MKNTPVSAFIRRSLYAVLVQVIWLPVAQARIGETQADIERRLLQQSGVGSLYVPVTQASLSNGMGGRRNNGGMGQGQAQGQGPGQAQGPGQRMGRRMPDVDPLAAFRAYLPVEIREVVYWKTAVPGNLSGPSGWHVYVLYVNGRSVLEAYVRVVDPLIDAEVTNLLALNRGASQWKHAEGPPVPSGIGYDSILADGSVRAKHDGDTFLIFASKVDTYIFEQAKAADEAKLQAQEAALREQQAKAPVSVSGF